MDFGIGLFKIRQDYVKRDVGAEYERCISISKVYNYDEYFRDNCSYDSSANEPRIYDKNDKIFIC